MRLRIVQVAEPITILQQIAGAKTERKHLGEVRRRRGRRYWRECGRGRRETEQRKFGKFALRIELTSGRRAWQQSLNTARVLRLEYVGCGRINIAIHGLVRAEQQGRGHGGPAVDLAVEHGV